MRVKTKNQLSFLMFCTVIGGSAGMTGIIVGLCYWAGDNLKFAKKYAREYSEVGVAVTMLMILCFPPRLCIWILVAAVISSKLISIGRHDGGNLAVGEDIA